MSVSVLAVVLPLLASPPCFESDTLGADKEAVPVRWSAGVDTYYAYDFTEPLSKDRLYTTQAFRHNEFNLNWGFLRADYASNNVRASLALQSGTYVQANYASEPNDLTRLIAQANAGVRLAKGVWLDAGILPSHIGYESTFSFENEVYTRALMAENSPYFETGAQLTAALSGKVELKLLVLNGWQIIQETNDAKSLGLGLTYTPTESIAISYNNYYGNEAPQGEPAKRRYFHNLYTSYALTDQFSLATSLDYGRQELWGSSEKGEWYAGMLLARWRLRQNFAVAGRLEHYNDEDQLIVATGTPNGFQTSSVSLDLDYIPAPNVLWRAEVRGYDATDKVFVGEDGAFDKNLLLVTSIAVKF